jgi:hypothetical protein
LNRFANSWKLFKSAVAVLAADRELLIFPILSTVGIFIVSLTFALPMFLSSFFDSIFSREGGIAGLVVGFAFYLVQYLVIFYSNTALVGAAMIRLEGGDPTIKDGFRIANSRLGTIFGYALIAATVGVLLKALSRRKGAYRVIGSVAGTAWNIATYLVVPVLAVEGVNPLEAIKRSVSLLKKTWGEQLIGNFGLGTIFGLATFILLLLGVPAIYLSFNAQYIVLGIILIFVLLLLLAFLGLAHGCLNGIYTAAVYQFASSGKCSTFFDDSMVRGAFSSK